MTHKDLDVWKLSMELVVDVYRLTDSFPKSEIFGLATQLKRATVSIPSNIAEGAARKGTKEFIQFLYIALGSISEVDTQLELTVKLEFQREEIINPIIDKLNHIKRKIINLIKVLNQKIEESKLK